MIISRTLNNKEDFETWEISEDMIPKKQKRHVRMSIKGITYLEPIDNGSCWLYRYMSVNPHLSYIPESLKNIGVKKSAPQMIKMFREDRFFDRKEVKECIAQQETFIKYVKDQFSV